MLDDDGFVEAIHAPNRLRLCGLLRPLSSAEFGFVRDTLRVSDATLSKTVRTLAELGYVRVTKAASDERGDLRRTTSIGLTAEGRRVFDRHVAALHRIAEGVVKP